MRMSIRFDSHDVKAIQAVVSANRDKSFLRQRVSRNVDGKILSNTREDYWLIMSMCLLSSQQRSGPRSRISQFLLETPFRLSLNACVEKPDIDSFIQHELENFGGIRFGPKISIQMEANLARLMDGGWDDLEHYADKLIKQRKSPPSPEHYPIEREAARFMQSNFKGFGPKQSRNFWQSCGITRYEFVLDSRVLKWLRNIGFPMPLSPMALGEEDYYCYVSDILRDWCARANILPCVFDAAIFSSYDLDDWPDDAPVY